ncbi:MAG: hypothetical protein V1736_11605 [Pseudomonadota bacterium]
MKTQNVFRLKDRHGFTMVAVIAVLICTSLALVAGWSLFESRGVAGFPEEQALAVAQSGLDAAMKFMELIPIIDDPDWNQAWPDLSGSVAGGSFVVTFPFCDSHHITLQSTGTYAGCTRRVTRGITRIARGANYVYYYGGTSAGVVGGAFMGGGTNLVGAAIYTNANIWGNGPWGGGGLPDLRTRLYRRNVVVASTAREARWTLATAKPTIGNDTTQVMTQPPENLNGVQHYRRKWQLLAAPFNPAPADYGTVGGALPWAGGVHTITPAANRFSSLTAGGGISTITTPVAGVGDFDLMIEGNASVTGTLILQPRPGARINLVIGGNMTVAGGARLADQPVAGDPTYIYVGGATVLGAYVGGQLTLAGTARVTGTHLRILAHTVLLQCSAPPQVALTRFPGSGELTFYVSSVILPDTSVQRGLFNQIDTGWPWIQAAGNLILDRSSMTMTLASSFFGPVYCYDDSTVFPSNSCAIRGTLIGDNPSAQCWSRGPGSGGQILEDVTTWKEPAGYMPATLGFNPVGTGGFSRWNEMAP